MRKVEASAQGSPLELRQELIWMATKARKANVIDQKALETIRKLCRESASTESNVKIQRFYEQFANGLEQKGLQLSPRGSSSEDSRQRRHFGDAIASDTPVIAASLKGLPSHVLWFVANFCEEVDIVSLACTCYALTTALFPHDKWPYHLERRLRALDRDSSLRFEPGPSGQPLIQEIGENDHQSNLLGGIHSGSVNADNEFEAKVLECVTSSDNLFQIPDFDPESNLRFTRNLTLTLFGRGTHLLTRKSKSEFLNTILVRFLLPKIRTNELHIRLAPTIIEMGRGRLSSGDALLVATCSTSTDGDDLEFAFMLPVTAQTPPVVLQGATEFTFFAVEADKRTISAVSTARISGGSRSYYLLVQADPTQQPRGMGTVYITTVGTRAAKFLGLLLHDDEYHFMVEVRSSAQGNHGQGSYDVKGLHERIDYQTPRLAYRVPGSYSEVSSRLGVKFTLPTRRLFEHCFIQTRH